MAAHGTLGSLCHCKPLYYRRSNMLALWTKVTNWMSDEEKGASMVEYALLVALIAVIAIVGI
jgi:hypothetical protein